jgi:transcriptional regulator with XRE-family HTH domain
MTETATWPLSEIAAQQINRLRKRAGMNREQLAERCRELGAPDNLTAAAIANIETGRPNPDTGRRRRDITVDELAIFGRALDVPPLLLLFPVGYVEQVEALPGSVLSTWYAAKWFGGEQPWILDNAEPDADLSTWRQNRAGLDAHRTHDSLMREWVDAESLAEAAREDMSSAKDVADREAFRRQVEWHERRGEQAIAALRQLRRSARGQGLVLPKLLPALAHIDDEDTR